LARLVDFLADRAGDVIVAAVRSLAEFSERGRPGSEPDLRELIVPFGRGAYVVQYRVEADRVVVARIFHGREDR